MPSLSWGCPPLPAPHTHTKLITNSAQPCCQQQGHGGFAPPDLQPCPGQEKPLTLFPFPSLASQNTAGYTVKAGNITGRGKKSIKINLQSIVLEYLI